MCIRDRHIDEEQHKILTGCTNKNILAMARKLSDMGVSMWIRQDVYKRQEETAIRESLEEAAAFAAGICGMEGAFGYGKKYE